MREFGIEILTLLSVIWERLLDRVDDLLTSYEAAVYALAIEGVVVGLLLGYTLARGLL